MTGRCGAHPGRAQGFTLIEVLVALGIVAITLVGVLAYRQIPSGGQLLGTARLEAEGVLAPERLLASPPSH